ncbi:glycosyltransferase [Burkholderia orbicola]|uniref:glycosyltransferase n=1 Tax=Burkholderia orbicola TaxID=2978683 RepID=UPI0039A74D7F
MNILICNERLLFRFGVDRLLLILAENLRKQGHHVTVIANNFNESVVKNAADQIYRIPDGAEAYIQLDTFTSKWIDRAWDELFWKSKPDVAIIGGWPFFSTIPVLEKHNCRTLFIDCGSVPLDGFEGHAREIQLYLKELRKKHLPSLTKISPISQFIAKSQSAIDAPSVSSETILLGADHMTDAIWDDAAQNSESLASPILDASKGERLNIINLGRWEPGCYKNSECVFQISTELSQRNIAHNIFVLADPQQFECPASARDHVHPVGFPSDLQLQDLMQACDVGISVSTWEGFNLPLAEMQWLNKPTLVFNVAAHPEVVVHPWYLCANTTEMVDKLAYLRDSADVVAAGHWQERTVFHRDFRWQRVIGQYVDLIRDLGHARRKVLIDVSNAAIDPANSGVIRVTRRLSRELQYFVDPVFVMWDPSIKQYVFPTEHEYKQLSQYNGPVAANALPRSQAGKRKLLSDHSDLYRGNNTWLLLTETIFEKNGVNIRKFCKQNGIRTAAIFYDAIPVLRPDYVKDSAIRENHADYMRGISHCDVVVPISQFSGDCLDTFWKANDLAGPQVHVNALPGEFGGTPRVVASLNSPSDGPTRILCVSTLEPRKGHRKILSALRMLAKDHPDFDWEMTFIGNRYAGAQDIADEMTAFCQSEPRAKWLGIVDDDTLRKAYSDSTLTIYASEIEGFGMPIMESLWHGKPCICHSDGVMRELASGGGCLTADMTTPGRIADALFRAGSDRALMQRLTEQAGTRAIKNWREYTSGFLEILDKSTDTEHEDTHEDGVQAAIGESLSLIRDYGISTASRIFLNALFKRLALGSTLIVTDKQVHALIQVPAGRAVFAFNPDDKSHDVCPGDDDVIRINGPIGVSLPLVLEELDIRGPYPDSILVVSDDEHLVAQALDIAHAYAKKQPLAIYLETNLPDMIRLQRHAVFHNNRMPVVSSDLRNPEPTGDIVLLGDSDSRKHVVFSIMDALQADH